MRTVTQASTIQLRSERMVHLFMLTGHCSEITGRLRPSNGCKFGPGALGGRGRAAAGRGSRAGAGGLAAAVGAAPGTGRLRGGARAPALRSGRPGQPPGRTNAGARLGGGYGPRTGAAAGA